MRRSSSSRAVGVVIVSAWIPPAFECTPRSRGQSDIVPLSISISAVCTISCRNTLYMFRFLPKATDTTVGPSRREGDGNFCEYPGEIQEDDGGIGAEANRNGSDPLGRSPVRGRPGSPSAHHDPFDVAGPRGIQAGRREARRLLDQGVQGDSRVRYGHGSGPVHVCGPSLVRRPAQDGPLPRRRSEEHTSELQSRLHLVCRLLLEKKKNQRIKKTSDLLINH